MTARAGTILGIGIGNLINLYNPEAVILSGTLCKTLPLYAAAAEAEARRHIFLREAQAVKFHESTLDRHSEAVGAVALASEYFFAEYMAKNSRPAAVFAWRPLWPRTPRPAAVLLPPERPCRFSGAPVK